MKLTWKDAVTTLLAIAGGAVVYAKFYEYTWTIIGGSWKSAVAALAATGVLMFAFSSFEFSNMSWLNMGEMVLGVVAIGLAITGMIATSSAIFYVLAGTLGVLWLVHTARHLRHSLLGEDTTTYHHHVPVH